MYSSALIAAAPPTWVKTIHINSLILASRSPFFCKLFSNGMGESEQRHVNLRIEASEEVSFMDLLNYIYSKTLPTALFALLHLLETASKFEVASCLRECGRSLQKLPMTYESALYCWDLPQSLLTSRTVQPLINAAKELLVAHFKDLDNVIDPELASKIVIRALHFKAEAPHQQRCLAAQEGNAASHQFVERAYIYRPVKVIEFELPHQRCTVCLDLKRNEVTHIFPDAHVCSETFHLGGREFFLYGRCYLGKRAGVHSFWLRLATRRAGSASYTVNYDIELRMEPSEEFVSKTRGGHTFGEGPGRFKYVFRVRWTDFLADDSPYFINGILNLRADLTINK